MDEFLAYITLNWMIFIQEHWYAILLVPIITLGFYLYGKRKSKKRIDAINNFVMSPKLQEAYDLVKNDYDFSTVKIISGQTTTKDTWGEYRGGIILISDSFIEWADIPKIACVLVHELAHHEGFGEEGAGIIGKDCYKRYG